LKRENGRRKWKKMTANSKVTKVNSGLCKQSLCANPAPPLSNPARKSTGVEVDVGSYPSSGRLMVYGSPSSLKVFNDDNTQFALGEFNDI